MFGSRRVLLTACVASAAAYIELAIWHGHTYNVLISSGLLGVGIAMGFAAMSNLVVAAVPQSQTGVATGMNTNIRNVGAAIGAGVATSVVVSSVLPNGTLAEHGYILAYVISAVAMVVAAGAALLIPHHVESVETDAADADTGVAATGGPSLVVVD
jgi:MFS family permease